ncbi:MAG: rRNA maturation RNase YbeY [Mycoplasmataceae bacterium]|nr:rRNA maturation RNase YbeY [Mycoplasmataceae bacterium]
MRHKLNIKVTNDYDFKYKKKFNKIMKIFCEEFNINKKINVDLLITDNDGIKTINNDYRGINAPTDILSFPFGNFIDYESIKYKYKPLGEIVMSFEKILDQAEEFNHSEMREFCYMFSHGLVHLNGLDHKKNKDEEIEFNSHVNNIIKIIGVVR